MPPPAALAPQRIVLTGVRAEVSPDYEEMEYYRYAYGQEPSLHTPERPPHRGGDSLLGRAADFIKRFRLPKAILLIVLLLLLVAALALWFGILPADWVRNLPLGPDKARTISQFLTEERRVASVPTPGIEEASAAPVKPDSSPPQLTAGVLSGASPTAASPPVEPQRDESPGLTGPAHLFSLQVDSRSDRTVSMARAEALRRAGLDAFTVPAKIPGKGLWYRVLIGRFDSASKAVESGENLRTKGLIGEALVLALPYAVEVKPTTADQAANVEALARRFGYLPILRPESRDSATGRTRLLRIEAFRTSAEAKLLVSSLRAEGLNSRLIRR